MANECPDIREALAQTITSIGVSMESILHRILQQCKPNPTTGFNYHENLWMRETDIVKPLSSMFAIT